MATKKDSAVNALAREGGLARARNLTPEERRAAARKAANVRWNRYYADADGEQLISNCAPVSSDAVRTVSKVEIDAYEQIWTKARDHKISGTCPCDECVDSVMAAIRNRYSTALARIDNGEKLDKGEGALFQLLTGGKANRWTRVYRHALRIIKRQG